MKIHEHQAKDFFRQYHIPIPKEILCRTKEETVSAAEKLGYPCVIKAQVLTGGRGKAGGIKLVKSKQEAQNVAEMILNMHIKSYKVEKVLVAEGIQFHSEIYVGLTIDRHTKSLMLMVSKEGGVEIEEVAKKHPNSILKIPIKSDIGIPNFLARNIALRLFDDFELVKEAIPLFQRLYHIAISTDASLVEINPLVVTKDNHLIALDGKMIIDDNAQYRQPEIANLQELDANEETEKKAQEKGLSYIKLNGNIGYMVNGAGLAMATMDLIKYYGGRPANFLDIGGSSNPQKVIDAINLILSDENVKVIMINIFGGITRCDDVAKGLLEALQLINVQIPIVVRLAGTNAKEGLDILSNSNLIVVNSITQAAQKAVQLAQ